MRVINFGWIGKDGLEEKNSFYEYIEEDIKRNLNRIEEYSNSDKKILEVINNKANIALNEIKKIENIKPVISWYDINPNNILVDKSSRIIGFLDAGGARVAVKEWDLAFIKMDLCRSKEEFNNFKEEYLKYYNIDEILLEALTIVVEIDDIAFQLETNTKLPIAYKSNFKNIIKKIQNM